MSGDGGDMTGGGGGGDITGGGGGKGGSSDSGGGGKGGSTDLTGGSADYSGASTAGDYTGGTTTGGTAGYTGGTTDTGGTTAFTDTGGTGGGGGTLDSFLSNPGGGGDNLSGPGPLGGGMDYSFDNSSYLAGFNNYTGGAPMAAGGSTSVFDTGTEPISNLASTPGQSAFETVSGGAAAAPGGATAAGTAAPLGITGNSDLASSTDLSSLSRKGSAGGGGANTASSGGNGILDSLGLSPRTAASSLAAGAGLLNNLVTGNKPAAMSPQLNTNAAFATETGTDQVAAGKALQQWQTTGTLPEGYESQLQQAAQAAKTRAISNAAAQGLPTDPTQNTALAQQLNAIDAALPGQREQIAAQLAQSGQQMINTGLQATGISSGVYQTLANLENQQNQQRGQAIANFASALNGGGNRGLTLKVA